jgi:hypothetical protein
MLTTFSPVIYKFIILVKGGKKMGKIILPVLIVSKPALPNNRFCTDFIKGFDFALRLWWALFFELFHKFYYKQS